MFHGDFIRSARLKAADLTCWMKRMRTRLLRVRSWRFRGTKRTNATLFVPQFQNQIATNYTEPSGSFHTAVLIAHPTVRNFQAWSRIYYYDLVVSAAVPSSSTLLTVCSKRSSHMFDSVWEGTIPITTTKRPKQRCISSSSISTLLEDSLSSNFRRTAHAGFAGPHTRCLTPTPSGLPPSKARKNTTSRISQATLALSGDVLLRQCPDARPRRRFISRYQRPCITAKSPSMIIQRTAQTVLVSLCRRECFIEGDTTWQALVWSDFMPARDGDIFSPSILADQGFPRSDWSSVFQHANTSAERTTRATAPTSLRPVDRVARSLVLP